MPFVQPYKWFDPAMRGLRQAGCHPRRLSRGSSHPIVKVLYYYSVVPIGWKVQLAPNGRPSSD
jgi:hypothetical protein